MCETRRSVVVMLRLSYILSFNSRRSSHKTWCNKLTTLNCDGIAAKERPVVYS